MRRIAIIVLTLVVSIAISDISLAKKHHNKPPKNIDPTCPVNSLGVPDPHCSSPSLELSEVKCPEKLSEDDCDFYKRGYGEAREDKQFSNELYQRDWKDDKGTEPAFREGYELGWKSRPK